MTKPVKLALGIVGGLLALVVVVIGVTVLAIDAVAKGGIEKGGSYALGVDTKLDKADVGLTSGKFTLAGLKVDNPEGFEGDFLNLGSGGVAVSLGTLMDETVELPRFELADVTLDLKRTATGSNYQAILDNLKRLESGQKPPQDKPGKKFKIKEVSITNVVVNLDLLGAPAGTSQVKIPIQEIKLTNVGSDGSGVDIPKLASILVEAVLAAAVEKGGGLIPADVLGDLQGKLSQLSGLANVGVETVGKLGEQVTTISKGVGTAAKDLETKANEAAKQLEGLGGLLQPKKDKK